MRTKLASAALAGVVLALAASAGGILDRGHSVAQETLTIGVDTDPAGNTATSLGSITPCLSVSDGDTFEVDVFVAGVTDLLAWETYLFYDPSNITLADRDVSMFQAANTGSSVFDASEGLPDIDGQYGIGAVDLAEPPAPDSGSGVLARLTLKAVGTGVSPLSLSATDVNGDGRMDLGPWLRDSQADLILDSDGDGFFDGPIVNAEIRVGGTCPDFTPVPLPSPTLLPSSPTSEPSPSPSPEATVTPTETTPTTAAASPTAPPGRTATATANPTATAPAASPTATTPADGGETSSDDGSPWIIAYLSGALAVVLVGGVALLVIRMRRAR
jgi:cell division septation protein DedD